MTSPIGDKLERELGVVINHGKHDIDTIRRVWRDITSHHKPEPYDSHSDHKETPMTADTLRADFENFLAKAEEDAAKVQKFEAEPLVQGVLDMLEAVPAARDILTPVLAGVGKLASMTPASPAAPVDPQIQTGVAQ